MTMRWLDYAYRLRRRTQSLVGWRTCGVKVAGFNAAGEVLLVRHRYGNTAAFVLPGGGVKWREAPEDAAWLEVSAGLGTAPTAPVRLACRPEATLLTLVPRLSGA